MSSRKGWSRAQLLVAFSLYCQMPFGKMHRSNPQIVEWAGRIGRTPSALAMKLTNIASLDPAITSTGRSGLKRASAADRAMWDEMSSDWECFALLAQQAEEEFGVTPSDEEGSDTWPVNYSGDDKLATTKRRVGQQFFRRAVLSAYSDRCCITGLADPKLLVASHIVPWRSNRDQRLNPRNGLCLSVLHDKAFDLGMITITENMTVQVSQRLENAANEFLKQSILTYSNRPIMVPRKFAPSEEFLRYHRSTIFQR